MKPFLFDHSFDPEVVERLKREAEEREAAELAALENAPPTFSVEEMETAKENAFEQGRQQGRAEAMASIEQQMSLTIDQMAARLPDLFRDYAQWVKEMQHDSVQLATQVMRKLAPELIRGNELPQIEHVINEAFKFLTNQPKVIIRVGEELAEPLSEKIDLLAARSGYEGEVVLAGDPELPPTDCRISWFAGTVERTLDESWEHIDAIVERTLQALPPRRERPAAKDVMPPESDDRAGEEIDPTAEPEITDLTQDEPSEAAAGAEPQS